MLLAASLHLAVQLEAADRLLLQQPGQLGVTVDLLLPDGTPLLQDLPTKLDEVRGQQHHHRSSYTMFLA
jgi:hypothetical protein